VHFENTAQSMDGTAYFAVAVNYALKMFIKLATGSWILDKIKWSSASDYQS
jgi:hypothetical protein